MSSPYYSYEGRAGIKPISWADFHSICKGLALAVSKYDPDLILGIARGGMYAVTLLSHLLQRELFPIRLTRRLNDVVTYEHPVWLTRPPDAVKGAKVLIVDEICGAGETLTIARDEVARMGAAETRCAVVYAHTPGKDIPDYIGLISDELLLNPWDREILRDGQYIFNPEYVFALEKQGISPDQALLPGIAPFKLAKDA
jgi:uncharacterized protein